MTRRGWRTVELLGFVVLLLTAACSGLVGPPDALPLDRQDDGKTIHAIRGQDIEIELSTLGPGRYATPDISSPAVRFVDEVSGPVALPSGPQQIFQFTTEGRGSAAITISHTWEENPEFRVEVVVR